jgi:hypothetical protein
MEQYNPYFSGSVPSDPAALARLTGMYESGTQARALEIKNQFKLGREQLANQYKIALLQSGDQRAQIEATREYQRGQLEHARQELERLNIPQMEINKFVAESNAEIAKGELSVKQMLAQGQLGDWLSQARGREADAAYKQGVLQQQRDEMLQMGIPKVMVDRFVAESQAAFQRGELGLRQEEMERIGIPKMLTDRYSAEAQAAYQQGQLGLTAQQQQQQAIEQQRRYALDVAKYGTELASTPDRYFQAQQFAAQAPRLLGLQAGAGPEGGPTPGINQMGSLLAQATQGIGNQATPYQMPSFPTMPGYTDPGRGQMPGFPTMPGYTPPPLGALPAFPGQQPSAPGAGDPFAPPGAPGPGNDGQGPGTDYGRGYVGNPVPGGGGFSEGGGGAGRPQNELYDPTGGLARYAQAGGAGGGAQTTGYYDPTGQYGGGGGGQMIGGGDQADLARQSGMQYGGGGQAAGGFPNIDPVTGGSTLPGGAMTNTGGGGGRLRYPTGTGTYGGPSAGARPTYAGGAPAPNLSVLDPGEQSRYRQIVARRAQLQAAGEPDVSAEDQAELARYEARMRAPSGYGAGDPREKQVAAIAKASPPSPYDGLNEQDQSTLKLLESVYKRGGQGIQGGEMERMGTAQRGFMASAGRLLGFDPDDLTRTYQQYRPAQGSSSLAG